MPCPFEFCISGTPVSQQARRRDVKDAWKQKVRDGATECWPDGEEPIEHVVQITITYYYEGAALDVDNMAKLILDAIKGVVLTDDDLVVDLKLRKRSVNGSYRIRHTSPVILEAFSNGDEFVHISVLDPPDPQELN